MWMVQHIKAGTVTWAGVLDCKFLDFGGYDEAVHGLQRAVQVWGWLEGMVWGLLQEAFAPHSCAVNWPVRSKS